MGDAYNMSQSVLAELGCKFAKSKIVYGVHALGVLDKIKIKRMTAQCKSVVYSFVLHWTQSLYGRNASG